MEESFRENYRLRWASWLRRTVPPKLTFLGPLRIYKTVPHNVAFLQSGSALKPLLSKTQCWNVDGKNIFCLQLRPGNYWRVEIMGYVWHLPNLRQNR